VEIYPDVGHPFRMRLLPDTGATETLISADLAHIYGIQIRTEMKKEIIAVNKSPLVCHGFVNLALRHLGKYETKLSAFVTPDLQDEMLLSWHHMIELGMLSPKFPMLPEDTTMAIRPGTTAVSIGDDSIDLKITLHKLFDDYPTVFDESDQLRPMRGEPIHIYLKKRY
jgi:hypothetical protein